MAYALNTSVCTRKVTLSSTGPYSGPIYNPRYILTKPLLFDERLMHICGVETVVVRHPTYFHVSYMSGETYYVASDLTQSQLLKFDATRLNAFLDGLYAQPKFLSIGLIDTVLMSLFKFLQGLIKDDGTNLSLTFNGFPTLGDYYYNGRSYDDSTMIDLNKVNDSKVAKHVAILTSLYQSSSFRFNILLDSMSHYRSIHVRGPFVSLFGLDNNREMVLTNGEPFSVQLPLFGHDYVCIGSNVCSNIQSMQAGSTLESTNLLTVMPLPKYCGYTETYSPPSASGRAEVVSNTIDTIELSFTDKFGNPLLSLENYVVTLLFDDVKPAELPQPHHTSLFKIRKGDMQHQREEATQELSKKLRTSYIY